MPAEWRCRSRAARHHPAQISRLAIAAHPVPGDLHQVRVRERPSALRTGQNRLHWGLFTHWVFSMVCKTALSVAQMVPCAKEQGTICATLSAVLHTMENTQ